MRADANNLLERLGRQDFAYREFADRFAELEPWPLFEALLKDRRLFASAAAESAPAPLARLAEQAADTYRTEVPEPEAYRPETHRPETHRPEPSGHVPFRAESSWPDPRPEQRTAERPAASWPAETRSAETAPAGMSLFSRYGTGQPEPRTRETQDIRNLLQALSQAGSGGKA